MIELNRVLGYIYLIHLAAILVLSASYTGGPTALALRTKMAARRMRGGGPIGSLRRLGTHLKVLLDQVPALAQALHDGLVPQDVLLAQVLPPLPGLQHQAVDKVEGCQEVPHALLPGEREGRGEERRPRPSEPKIARFSYLFIIKIHF